jgi:hypothetical protein
MRAAILITLVALAACGSRIKTAEKRHAFLQANGGSADEICTAARKVRDEAVEAGDQKAFQEWDITAGMECNEAALRRLER